jgi:hypothetical protein
MLHILHVVPRAPEPWYSVTSDAESYEDKISPVEQRCLVQDSSLRRSPCQEPFPPLEMNARTVNSLAPTRDGSARTINSDRPFWRMVGPFTFLLSAL